MIMSNDTDYSAYLDCGESKEYRRMFQSLPSKVEEEDLTEFADYLAEKFGM